MEGKKDFLSVSDLSAGEIRILFSLAGDLKRELKTKGFHKQLLKGKSQVLVFEKQSLRTRVSFEIGMAQFGGNSIYLDSQNIGIGTRESVSDIARVLSSMANIIITRTYAHKTVEEIANCANVPVINGLSDIEHPCQALADLFTIWEIKGKLSGLTVSYVGDGDNNLAHSLCIASSKLGMKYRCASPIGYSMNKNIINIAQKYSDVLETEDPVEAVKGADVVVTDTWTSMGDTNKEERLKIFRAYQVNAKLMSYAKKDAVFMHCLPAYRGNEVTAEVIDGNQSVVFQEAENRLHIQKALLLFLLGKVRNSKEYNNRVS